jgi:hypothetical protein
MRLIRRLSLLVLLAVLLAVLIAGPASAQSLPPPTGLAKAIQLQSTDAISCSEPPHPQSVNAEVDLCVNALVKTDVQETPGVRLDVTVLPENDPEMLAMPDPNEFPSRAPLTRTTSWGPPAIGVQKLSTSRALSESARPPPEQFSAIAILASTEVQDNASLDLTKASELDRNLARARIRKQEEARLRQSRQLQRDLNEQCRQMHLSTLECRLKLKDQKLATVGHRAVPANSSRQANR